MMRKAIVIGYGAASLGVIRSLGLKGFQIMAMYYDKADFSHTSKYVYERVKIPHPRIEEREFISAAPETTFIIFSPHGMGPNYSGSHLLTEVLRRLGMVVMPVKDSRSIFTHLSKYIWPRWLSKILDKLIETLPLEIIKMMRRMLPKEVWDNLTCYLLVAGDEWKWSRAFCILGDFPGAINNKPQGA